MGVHSYLLQRAAAKLAGNNAAGVQFRAEGAAAVDVDARVGPEEMRLVETGPTGDRALMRVRNVEFEISQVATAAVGRDAFVIDGEDWTVNLLSLGEVLGIAEVVRQPRAERAGRGRLGR